MDDDARWLALMADTYDSALGPALFAPFAVHLAERAAAAAPARVLELAAGTGLLTRELVRALPRAQITATDVNAAMVDFGRERVAGAAWSVADAGRLPLPTTAYDLVVCQFGAMFFPDRPAAYAEAGRVLVTGGSLLLAVWDAVALSPFPQALVESLAVVLPEDPPTFVARVPHGYADPDRLAADLVAGGLVPGAVERVVLQGHAASARRLAEGFCLGTPLRFALQARGRLDELTAAVADELERRLGAGPVQGDLAALVVSAQAP